MGVFADEPGIDTVGGWHIHVPNDMWQKFFKILFFYQVHIFIALYLLQYYILVGALIISFLIKNNRNGFELCMLLLVGKQCDQARIGAAAQEYAYGRIGYQLPFHSKCQRRPTGFCCLFSTGYLYFAGNNV